MTVEILILFAVLAAMVVLFLTERLPIEVTAFAGLVVMIFAGYVPPGEAFTGFSSPAVITMLAIFLVSGGLQKTGVADMLGARLHKFAGRREATRSLTLMSLAGALSSFMNNIAATAVLLPAVASLGRKAHVPPTRLFMPLAFGAILGGTTTLVGTPPNILAAEMLARSGREPFRLFDFTPLGVILLLGGMLFMITLGRRLLPVRRGRRQVPHGRDLSRVYRLHEQLFSLRIREGSALEGRTLGEAQFGKALRVQVLAITRNGKTHPGPGPDETIRGGDLLLVEGSWEDLQELLRVQRLEIDEGGLADLSAIPETVRGICVRLRRGSDLAGKTPRELRFRSRFGVVIAGIRRDDGPVRERPGGVRLRGGDELIALGSAAEINALGETAELEVVETGTKVLESLGRNLFTVAVKEGSPLVGASARRGRVGELARLIIAAVIRDGKADFTSAEEDLLRAGDHVLVVGEPDRVMSLLQMTDLEPRPETPAGALETEESTLAEAVLSPRSHLVGKTLAELDFRERYQMQVLALWRDGEPIHTRLARLVLRPSDALLLQGERRRLDLLARDADFVVLSAAERSPLKTRKAPFAVGALLLMVALVVLGIFPIQVAAFAAAVVVLLSGALTMEEAYRCIEWRAIFLVAAILPVGVAMERTGAAAMLADNVIGLTEPLGPYATLAALVVLSSLLSQGLDGAPTVVLLAPVVFHTSELLEINVYTLMMGVSLAASAAFMTPFSHKANLLVMGAGCYRPMDYVRVGTPLTVVVLGLLVLLVPVVFPFGG